MEHRTKFAVVLAMLGLGLLGVGYSVTRPHRGATGSFELNTADSAAELSVTTSVPNQTREHAGPHEPQRRLLADSHAELLSLAQNGDLQAAKKLFEVSQQCSSAAAFLSTAAFNSCNQPVDPNAENACVQQNAAMAARVQRAQDDRAACSGITDADLNQMRYQATMAAAKLGDADAQACAVEGEFDLRQMPISQEEIEEYKSDVSGYFENGLRRGDWRVVQSLTLSMQALSHMHGILFSAEQGKDLTIYRMTALLRQGAVGEYASALNAKLKEYEEARANGLQGFDPEQLDQAMSWAKDEYQRHFVNSAPLSSAPVVCGAKY